MEAKEIMALSIEQVVADIEKTKSVIGSLRSEIQHKLSKDPSDQLFAAMKQNIDIIGTRLEGIEAFIMQCKIRAMRSPATRDEELDIIL
ncbi:MAG: hypothetical protein H3C35_02430 [Bacteroidetes bacterium]|nr:hypothetical protein [Bacteroidota bacterium]